MSSSSSRLEALARAGRFCVTSEVVPPRSADPEPVERQARELVGYADAANVTDNPTASAHMSPVAGAAIVARAGLEPTLQVTVRDRNRLALAADLLGAWALGARNLLCLTGDPPAVGDQPEAATVHDLDVLELLRLSVSLRERGRLPSGVAAEPPPRYFVGVADSPLAERYDPARLEVKLDAGAAFVMTQIAYDLDRLKAWVDVVRSRGVLERAAVLVGVAPLRSARQARYMNEHLPGVHVPDALVAALADAGPEAVDLGTAQCVEIVTAVQQIPGVAGVHVMGLGHEEAVRRVIEGAGLLPRPVPMSARSSAYTRPTADEEANMAETVTIQGQPYLKRNPLGVLGLSLITLGIYGLYWYYKVNQEIRRYTGDETISPSRSLLAVIPGFLLIVPPFIAYYNTSNHIVRMQEQRGMTSQISPALVVILGIVIWIGMAAYVQEHLNRVWDAAANATGMAPVAPPPPPPPA